uniref:Uncharacterized protein n=1 Tax=Anopheles atroparvus TaxID=41427 RepID=A0A182J2G8_ANOAO
MQSKVPLGIRSVAGCIVCGAFGTAASQLAGPSWMELRCIAYLGKASSRCGRSWLLPYADRKACLGTVNRTVTDSCGRLPGMHRAIGRAVKVAHATTRATPQLHAFEQEGRERNHRITQAQTGRTG